MRLLTPPSANKSITSANEGSMVLLTHSVHSTRADSPQNVPSWSGAGYFPYFLWFRPPLQSVPAGIGRPACHLHMEAPAGQNRIDADGDVALSRETIPGSNDDRFRVIAEAIPGMVWTCTPDGRCDYVSRRWPEYTGADFQEALSDGASSFVHADDMARVQEVWKRAVEAGRGDETQLRLRRRDGVYRWHLVRGVPECDAHGQITHWVGVAIDIEELAATHATLTHAKEELERTVADRTHQLQEVVEQLEAFAYSIAHDMRAPLRTMHQYAQIVARDYAARVPDDVRIYTSGHK